MCKKEDFSDMGKELYSQISFIYLMRSFAMADTLLDIRDEKIDSWHLPSRACKDLVKEEQIHKQCSVNPVIELSRGWSRNIVEE